MAGPTYKSSGSTNNDSGTSVTFDAPLSIVSGNPLLCFLYQETQTSGHATAPTGFTEKFFLAGERNSFSIFLKNATGSEPANYTFTNATAAFMQGVVVQYQGAPTSGDVFDVIGAGAIITQALATNKFTAPAIATTQQNTLLLLALCAFDGVTVTPPAGFTTRVPDGISNSDVMDGAFAAGGSIGPLTALLSGNEDGIAVLLAMRNPGPLITSSPASVAAAVGGTANFTVAATATAGSLTYQWRKNGSNVSGGTGGTSASYTTGTLVSGDDGAVFDCQVTDSNGTVLCLAATLTLPPPAIKRIRADITAVGGNVALSESHVSLAGSETYQWQTADPASPSFYANNPGTASNISGATTSSYSYGPVSSADHGRYFRVKVTDANGTTTSGWTRMFIRDFGTSGRGRLLNSAWLLKKWNGSRAFAVRKLIAPGAKNAIAGQVFSDWFFGVADTGGISGTASRTVATFTRSSTGALAIAGAGNATLEAFSRNSTGVSSIAGAASRNISDLSRNSTGELAIAGAGNATLEPFTRAAAGALAIGAVSDVTLDAFTRAAAGTLDIAGQSEVTLEDFSRAATGILTDTAPIEGQADRTLDAFTRAAAGELGPAPVDQGGGFRVMFPSERGTFPLPWIHAQADRRLEDFTRSARGRLGKIRPGAVMPPIHGVQSVTVDHFTRAAAAVVDWRGADADDEELISLFLSLEAFEPDLSDV